MAIIRVSLTRIVDHSFPFFGSFEFADLSGEVVVIHEKLPVIGVDYVEGETILPIDVDLECKVVSTSVRGIVIDISEPYAMEDIHGRTEFHVRTEMVVR